MLKAWDTMRAHGLSCCVNIGRSRSFDEDSRNSVTTVAFETSAVRTFWTRKSTRPSTPAALAFADLHAGIYLPSIGSEAVSNGEIVFMAGVRFSAAGIYRERRHRSDRDGDTQQCQRRG